MKKYGLIGKTLKHSFSQKYFTEKFVKENIPNARYDLYELESIDKVISIISSDLVGFNVTIPYKEAIFDYLDEVDEIVKCIGAVNVVKHTRVEGKSHLKGYNTDIIGFKNSFVPNLNSPHKKALILGTGGASKAVAVALHQLGIEFKFVSRTAKQNMFTYEDLSAEVLNEYKVIINCTPLGTYPNVDSCPSIAYEYLSAEHYCYDLVYNPEITKFMQLSQEQGAFVKNGYEMLVGQAEAAWKIWTE